jgi:hypothetical protein
MLRLSTEYNVKVAHVQCVDVSTRKIAFVRNDMRSASSGTDAVDRHEVLGRPCVRLTPRAK